MGYPVGQKNRRNLLPPAWAGIAALSFLIAALLLLNAGISRWWLATISSRWPEAEGLIIESRLDANCHHCYPVINYRYVVNGQSFIGDHIVAGSQDYYNAVEAEAKVTGYSMGRKISVKYDPRMPSKSCLECGVVRWTAYLFLMVGVSLLGASLILVGSLYATRWTISKRRPIDA